MALSDADLKKLHEVQVEILKDVDKFCKKHEINYFLVGGTLIGALRHQGFIPWDDDIDIGMPREDYEKFIRLYNKDQESPYFVQAMEIDPNYWHAFSKVRKKNTLMEEKNLVNLNLNKEIFIDVFPYDVAPDSGYNRIRIRSILIKVIREVIYKKRNIIKLKECRFKILSFFLSFLSVKTLYRLQKKLMTKYQNKKTNYLVCYLGETTTKDEYLKKDVFIPVKKGLFEGHKFNIMNQSEIYLTSVYGNFMELPPIEKRVSHDILRISLDTRKK